MNQITLPVFFLNKLLRTCGLISKRFILTTWRNLKNLVVNQLCKVCLLSFYLQDRPYSYEIADVSEINVMLNNNDVSDYLKISPTGLEVRNPMDWYMTYIWLVKQVEHFIVHKQTVANTQLQSVVLHQVSDKMILKWNCSLWYISGRKECVCPLFQSPRRELKIHYVTCILTHFKHCLECVIYPLNRKHVLLYQIITWLHGFQGKIVFCFFVSFVPQVRKETWIERKHHQI